MCTSVKGQIFLVLMKQSIKSICYKSPSKIESSIIIFLTTQQQSSDSLTSSNN